MGCCFAPVAIHRDGFFCWDDMATLIFANGEFKPGEWIAPYVEEAETLIGVDGGTRHMLDLDLRPDWVIGDFDSLSEAIQMQLEAQGTRFRHFDVEKDETDLELALLHAAEQGSEPLYVAAALGARLDQMLANILLLAHASLGEKRVVLIAPHQKAWLVRGQTRIKGTAGDRVSLIPLGGDVHVVRTTGLKWVLEKEWLRFGPARGISNEMSAGEASVEIDAGTLLCVQTDGDWDR